MLKLSKNYIRPLSDLLQYMEKLFIRVHLKSGVCGAALQERAR